MVVYKVAFRSGGFEFCYGQNTWRSKYTVVWINKRASKKKGTPFVEAYTFVGHVNNKTGKFTPHPDFKRSEFKDDLIELLVQIASI